MIHQVVRFTAPPPIDADWEKAPWRGVEPLPVDQCVGGDAVHRPKTLAKIAYDPEALYVIFRVEDQYVRAVAAQHDGAVWRDSCVEFFFTPGEDMSRGYFNLEMNCGGTMLLHFQKAPRQNSVHLSADECRSIQIAHTMPKIVEPEAQTPVTWLVEYRLPIAVLDGCCEVDRPAPGVAWRANFYKCGDRTSHPHWLAWSPITVRPPDFHRPDFFGTLKFE